jgi:hypothetical protein
MWLSLVAVAARLSDAVPSPQSTVIPVTGKVLETVNVTMTVAPVLAGLGLTPVIFTVGARGEETVSLMVPDPREPELSVAVTVIAYEPVALYT